MSTTTLPNLDSSLASCRTLATSHYENFHVLSGLLPRMFRDDFAILYSFCRAADDAADERENTTIALEELNGLRAVLDSMGSISSTEITPPLTTEFPFNPFVPAWIDLIRRHHLPLEPFHKLLDAFVQDQHQTRYETWEEVLNYCTGSADPVGRLVLMITDPDSETGGYDHVEKLFPYSDSTCTALQLTNFWQDISRDYLDRDRIYIPLAVMRQFDLAEDDLALLIQHRSADSRFVELEKYLVEYTQRMFDHGHELWPHLAPAIRPVIKLFSEGGESILRAICKQNYDVLARRPTLSKSRKAQLYFKTKVAAMFHSG